MNRALPPVRLAVGPEHAGLRLDVFLATALAGEPSSATVSRSAIQRLILAGEVLVDGRPAVRASARVAAGQTVTTTLPEPQPTQAWPEDIALEVVYEDQYLLAVNKPRGMVVHPAAGHRSGTLVNAVLARCPELARDGDLLRPGIVHRLDRDTTGLILVARDPVTREALGRMIASRELKRTYLALVHGHLPGSRGEMAGMIARSAQDRRRMAVVASGGRTALTRWRRLESLLGFDWIEVQPHTGRTHQIRVHLAHSGHPVAGDQTYGGRRPPAGGTPQPVREALEALGGQALHAWKLTLVHPRLGGQLDLEAGLPGDLRRLVAALYLASGQPPPGYAGTIADLAVR